MRDRGFSPREEQAFAAWLRADPQNRSIFAEFEETWSSLGKLSPEIPPKHERSEQAGVAFPPTKKAIWFGAAFAAAAAIAVLWVAWPALGVKPSYTVEAVTEVGAQRTLALPDGSSVRLNTDTEVAVTFSSGERQVRLNRGQAEFLVAKDRARPFVVTAGVVVVKAVGTAFDVRVRREAVEVLVTEGSVRVDDAPAGKSLLKATTDANDPLLSAGHRVVIPVRAGVAIAAAGAAVSPAEIARAMAWRSGRLEFVKAPLAEILEEFNRYNPRWLVLADPRLADLRLGGTFALGDTEEFVRLLEAEFGVTAEHRPNETHLRLKQ